MKYKVTIGWRCEFLFDDVFAAAEFMLLAANHRIQEEDAIKLEVIFPEVEVSEEGTDD